jgi:hypothetical protein
MQRELDDRETVQLERSADAIRGLNRRHLIGGAVSGFVMGTHGLLLPAEAADKPDRDHIPVRRLQDRADQRRRHQSTERARKRRHGRSGKTANQQDDSPRGRCVWDILDMTLIFKGGSTITHNMTVVDNGTYRWKNQVVRPHEEFQFVGWHPDLELELYTAPPYLYFRAENPCLGAPIMDIREANPSGPPIPRFRESFGVGEQAGIQGFSIKRLEDADEHKVFLITSLD